MTRDTEIYSSFSPTIAALMLGASTMVDSPLHAQVTWPVNGHTYLYVSFRGDWMTARASAASMIDSKGQPGYLATITTAGENSFLVNNLPTVPESTAWIGGTDEFIEGSWVWATGPEAGLQFWVGPPLPAGSVTPPFMYAGWRPFVEPNNYPVGRNGEDYSNWAMGPWAGGINKGEWVDADVGGTNSGITGFIVEFGSPFRGLGNGLAGTLGVPVLSGNGPLLGGTPLTLSAGNALPLSPGAFVIGSARLDLPIGGGILVPSMDLVIGVPTDQFGAARLTVASWPHGTPSGLALYAQYWVADQGGPRGLAASHGIAMATP